MHPFEKTLGQGPYKFVGYVRIIKPSEQMPEGNYRQMTEATPIRFVRGMGTCAHCNMAIMNVFMVEIGNGDVFGVGCDCILKVGLPAQELNKVKKAQSDLLKQQRLERKLKNMSKAQSDLDELLEEKAGAMMGMPHPTMPGKTLYQYAVWVRDNVRNPGKTVKYIKTLIAG